jgi:hypothetical protein
MKFFAQFFDRQSNLPKSMPRARLDVKRFGTTALWGPDKASAKISGRREELWRFVDMLRDGVELYDEHGECVWWGYLYGMSLNIGSWKVRFSLDKTANTIQIAYTAPGASGTKKLTVEEIEEDSINLYGRMQIVYSASDITDAQAARLSNILWTRIAYPVASVVAEGGGNARPQPLPEGGEYTGELTFRGWHTCLDWQYARREATGDVDTATQVANLINTFGTYQVRAKLAYPLTLPYELLDIYAGNTFVYVTDTAPFSAAGTLAIGTSGAQVFYAGKQRDRFTGCTNSGSGTFAAGTYVYGAKMLVGNARVESASGLVVSDYKRGDASALREVEDLLQSGTINKRRLLCSVERDRSVRIYEEPGSTTEDVVLRLDGSVERIGTRWINPYAPSGVWASMRELFGGLQTLNSIHDVSAVFIEKCEWDAERGAAMPTLRDNDNPLDVSTVVQG